MPSPLEVRQIKEAAATAYGRTGILALLAVAVVLMVVGCGGSSPSSVAAIGTTNAQTTGTHTGGSVAASTSTVVGANPARLLAEWGACMRRHGDPDQLDPSIDVHKVIVIPWNPAVPGGYNGTNKGGQGNSGPGQYCRTYLQAAQTALRGGTQPERPDQAQVVKYSQCMRANGVPDFPDPTAKGLQINRGGDLNPNSPAFQNASKLCARKTGVRGFGVGTPPPGTIQLANAGTG